MVTGRVYIRIYMAQVSLTGTVHLHHNIDNNNAHSILYITVITTSMIVVKTTIIKIYKLRNYI